MSLPTHVLHGSELPPPTVVPRLRAGDRLSRNEFERRYEAMPEMNKAELIEGVVHMPSPVSISEHASPHARLIAWLVVYESQTPGVQVGDNGTIRLDWDNCPQPDAMLRILPEYGGQSRNEDKYVTGAPELVAEVAASSASIDLHDKLNAYRRNGVKEYLVWRVLDNAVDWLVHRGGEYRRLDPDEAGIFQSEVFPGLWLDASALLAGKVTHVLDVLQKGLATDEHTLFARRLASARSGHGGNTTANS